MSNFLGLDDAMPSNLNDRVPREQAKIPNARDWAVRDYGNRVGIWQLMDRPQSDQCAAADRDGPGAERAAIRATLDRTEAASRALGWLGAGLAETWNMLAFGIARFRRVHPGLPSLIALKVTPNAPKTHPTET